MARFLDILPVILLIVFAAAFGFIAYQIYIYTHTVVKTSEQELAKKNINFSKDGGLQVGVKEVSTEQYGQRLQKGLVDTWNARYTPPPGEELGGSNQDDALSRSRSKM